MEKSANRGRSFPLLDVPTLVEKYMEVQEEETKSASINFSWEMDLDNTHNLPDAFVGLCRPNVSGEAISVGPDNGRVKRAYHQKHLLQLEVQAAQQQKFDAQEDARNLITAMVKEARQDFDFSFTRLERDANYLYGPEIQPTMDVLANFFKTANIRVERTTETGPERLLREYPLLKKVATVQAQLVRVKEAEATIKQAASVLDPEITNPGPAPNFSKPSEEAAQPQDGAKAPKGSPGSKDPDQTLMGTFNFPGNKSTPGASAKGKAEKGKDEKKPNPVLSGAHTALDTLGKPVLDMAGERVKKILDARDNPDQRRMDQTFNDVRQVAMLQNVLTTDEVLSEADPERVVDVFNTIRMYAPSLAGDANIMRVALRSALQHDGISPFDIKSFLDTELAGQKVDINRRALDGHLYRGKELGKSQ
jgi:hypothetical protein